MSKIPINGFAIDEKDLWKRRSGIPQAQVRCCNDIIQPLEEKLDAANARIAGLEGDLEYERIRLAACGVAATANTVDTVKQRINKDAHYYSASYGDVCSAVDREMAYREKVKELEGKLDEAIDVISTTDPLYLSWTYDEWTDWLSRAGR